MHFEAAVFTQRACRGSTNEAVEFSLLSTPVRVARWITRLPRRIAPRTPHLDRAAPDQHARIGTAESGDRRDAISCREAEATRRGRRRKCQLCQRLPRSSVGCRAPARPTPTASPSPDIARRGIARFRSRRAGPRTAGSAVRRAAPRSAVSFPPAVRSPRSARRGGDAAAAAAHAKANRAAPSRAAAACARATSTNPHQFSGVLPSSFTTATVSRVTTKASAFASLTR